MQIEDMTHEQRQAEIKHIQTEHRDILSTPLISEGNIDPDAISAMSDRKKKAWGEASETKLGLLATMHALSATDADIAERKLSRARDKVRDAEDSAENHIRWFAGLGRMAHKKNGDLKIGYVRSIEHDKERIAKAKAELAEMENVTL